MGKVKRREDAKRGLRVVAVFEGAKGLLVLLQALGFLRSFTGTFTRLPWNSFDTFI